jgi:hypothetical protein
MPNTTIRRGKMAIFGIGYIAEIIGEKKAFNRGYQPINSPKIAPTKEPQISPIKNRNSVAPAADTNSPLRVNFRNESKIFVGGGKNVVDIIPTREQNSQASRNPIKVRVGKTKDLALARIIIGQPTGPAQLHHATYSKYLGEFL